jgi:hypothetical protein
MTQDIRGATVCKICGHYGYAHCVGFFCIANGCQCGHHKDDKNHQEFGGVGGGPCLACKPKEAPKPEPPVARPVDERMFDPDFNGT